MDSPWSNPEEQISWLRLIAFYLPPALCFSIYAFRLRQNHAARRWGLILVGSLLGPTVLLPWFLATEPGARVDLLGALMGFLLVTATSAAPLLVSSELLRQFALRKNAAGPWTYTVAAVGAFVLGIALTIGAYIALMIGLSAY
ncbi:MAG: hypothetical protein JNL44_06095 [Gemmatimonadetes bacterium]|nr:hypothetical protein [Gemmatimonadota bacterium]